MIDGLAKSRSLTSTECHSKYTKAAANGIQSRGSGNVCHGIQMRAARTADAERAETDRQFDLRSVLSLDRGP